MEDPTSEPPNESYQDADSPDGSGNPLERLLRDMHDDERSPTEHGKGPASDSAQPAQPGFAETEMFDQVSMLGDDPITTSSNLAPWCLITK